MTRIIHDTGSRVNPQVDIRAADGRGRMGAVIEDVPTAIEARRNGRGQIEIADEIGVSQSTVNRWLAGGAVDRRNVAKLAAWLGVAEDELVVALHRQAANRKRATTKATGQMPRALRLTGAR